MIRFFSEDVDFVVAHPIRTKRWIKQVVESGVHRIRSLNFVFCSDLYLLQMNVSYLQHDTLTDVITFDLSEYDLEVEGEVYISIDRVRENATMQSVTFDYELHRVMVHGVLHLLGYGDKSEAEVALIRSKEDSFLQLLHT